MHEIRRGFQIGFQIVSPVHPSPLQLAWHVVLPRQTCVQLPPSQENVQVAPIAHDCMQPPPTQATLQVLPAVHSWRHVPAMQVIPQLPSHCWRHPPD